MTDDAIREVTGKAALSLLHCEECLIDSYAQGFEEHPEFPWIVSLFCKEHKHHPSWYVCTTCTSQRKPILELSQLTRHNRQHHKDGKKRARFLSAGDGLEESQNWTTFDGHNDGELGQRQKGSLDTSFNFSRRECADYFSHAQSSLGAEYLVGYSTFAMKEIAESLDAADVNLEILLTSLSDDLTRGQRAKLSMVLGMVVTNMSRLEYNHEWGITVPTNPSSLRRRIMEGKNAIKSNLPHPPVTNLGKDHAYVSLKDIVADFLAHGRPYTEITEPAPGQGVTRVGECCRAQAIKQKAFELHKVDSPVIILCLIEWEDDFQPLNSNKGQKKGASAWTKTVTIVPPGGVKNKSILNTYTVAMGPKGANHEEVESKFKDELLQLSSGSEEWFYDQQSNKMKHVHLEMLACLADQPERRGGSYIALGNSNFHARFGYCCDFGYSQKMLPACQNCFGNLISTEEGDKISLPPCESCTCWTTLGRNCLDFPPPKSYPTEMLLPSGKVSPYQLTFESLIEVVKLTHDKVFSGVWKNENAKIYMRVHCLSGAASDGILEHAHNARNFQILYANREKDEEGFVAILKERELSPHLFEMWPIPSWWTRGVLLSQHIEASMHLLSGVMKALTRAIQQWTACNGNKTSFLRYALPLLDGVQELQLNWCKCPTYTGGSLPGWVSENYMALARLSKWFYSGVRDISKDPTFVEPTNLVQSKWLKRHNEGWLKLRGLNSTGSAAELRQRVRQFLDDPNGPPNPLSSSGGSVEDTMKLIVSLSSMMYRLMARIITDELLNDIERSVKIFLNRYCEFDEQVYPVNDPGKKPSWLAKYNFPCLLNLRDVLREFGSLRNLWEGGYQGEGFLRGTKAKLGQGLRNNWQANTVTRLLESTALNVITDCRCPDYREYEERIVRISNAYVYTGVGMVHRKFSNGSPLSVVLLRTGVFGCLLHSLHDNEDLKLAGYRFIEVERLAYVHCHNGMMYHKWKFDMQRLVLNSIQVVDIVSYCLLLPTIMTEGGKTGFKRNGVYTLITSDWEEMLEDGTIGLHPVVVPLSDTQ